MREQHLAERLEAYRAQDWRSYADIIAAQQLKEVKVFNRVTLDVLNEVGIKQSVFNQSVELYMITSEESMLQAAKLSLFTPFKLKEEFAGLDSEDSLEMLKQATDAAVQLVQAPEILQMVHSESDLLLFYDCLMQDYIHSEMAIDIE